MLNNGEKDLTSTTQILVDSGSKIIIAFQYGGDEEEYANEGPSKFQQDYFDWVLVFKKVDNALEIIFEYECA